MQSIYIEESKDNKEMRSRNINKCEKAERQIEISIIVSSFANQSLLWNISMRLYEAT